mmetsp:Transcript_6247/g.15920  ORF Transcript_6247/g.15920 Transcript_6247/m.15920 type:complete len:127 (+) Transcript_6247:11-391(+)
MNTHMITLHVFESKMSTGLRLRPQADGTWRGVEVRRCSVRFALTHNQMRLCKERPLAQRQLIMHLEDEEIRAAGCYQSFLIRQELVTNDRTTECKRSPITDLNGRVMIDQACCRQAGHELRTLLVA